MSEMTSFPETKTFSAKLVSDYCPLSCDRNLLKQSLAHKTIGIDLSSATII